MAPPPKLLRLKPGASTYRGTAVPIAEMQDAWLVRRPDGSRWLWPKEWVEIVGGG